MRLIRRFGGILVAAVLLPASVRACDTALLLAIDVSSSIDQGEYRLQVDGLADALLDPEVADALELGQTALAVIQWSGVGEQAVVLPWQRMVSRSDISDFAHQVRNMRRLYINSDTAIGDAIAFSAAQFGAVADCRRKVIDISGDGPENAGGATALARRNAERAGVTINGIAIETIGLPLTNFYRRIVVTHDGFVVTARGHSDYPRAIAEKIKREVSKVLG